MRRSFFTIILLVLLAGTTHAGSFDVGSGQPFGSLRAAIIQARGASSAASAANAALDTVMSLLTPTAADDCVSIAVTSHGEYGVPEGLTFGFPIQADGQGGWKVKEGFALDDFAHEKIKVTTDELLAERDEVRALGLI